MAFTVLYDANVLYGNTLRDMMIRLARTGLVQAKWTDVILDEMTSNLAAKRPDIGPAKLYRLRELMIVAVPDCLVSGFEPLIEGLKLPDLDDRHVLAAAVKVGAQVIVTANLRDFPADTLADWNMEAKSPDEFCWTKSPSMTGSCGPVFSRSQIRGVIHRSPSRMSSTRWRTQAWSHPCRRCEPVDGGHDR
ncbi:PIN domain-containing protein [Nocardia halotolerans]|uniref:PIN domain-containing protein n=1 Tax=Nocardia halotolerans TaxID=1755878 RepID=A0ABV8VGG4_9NOCA